MTKLARIGAGALTPATWQRRMHAWLSGKAESTRKTYERDIRDFVTWAGYVDLGSTMTALAAGSPEEVRVRVQSVALEYAADLRERPVWKGEAARKRGDPPVRIGLAPATVARYLAAYRALVLLAQTAGRCPDVVLPSPPKLTPFKDTRGIGRTAWLSLLDAVDAALDGAQEGSQAHDLAIRDRAILRLLHDGALRRAEVVRLELADVAPDRRSLMLWGKGRSSDRKRPWPLGKAPAVALEAWLEVRGLEPGALFCKRVGSYEHMFPRTVNKLVERWGRRIGMRVTPHQLRHTALTTLAQRTNGNVVSVQGFARHSDPRTTMFYIDNLGEDVREMQDVLGDED